MVDLTRIPQDVLHVLCEHLDLPSLRSLSLSTRAVSDVYQRYYCRHFAFNTSVRYLKEKRDLLWHWQDRNQLRYVHYLTIDDTAPRSDEGDELIVDVIEAFLPLFTGLKAVTWHIRYMRQGWDSHEVPIDDREEWGFQNVFSGISMPPNVKFHINCLEQAGQPGTSPKLWLLRSAPAYINLHSLRIEIHSTCHEFDRLFKKMLLSCAQLKFLNLTISNNQTRVPYALCPLNWTPQEVKQFPVLKELGFHHKHVTSRALEVWAEHADWSHLQSLTLEDGRMLEYLAGRTPRLMTLTVGGHKQIEHFLAQASGLSALTITRFRSTVVAPSSPQLYLEDILALPFARNLMSLQIRMNAPYQGTNRLFPMDISAIPPLCPNLQNLAFSLTQDESEADADLEFEQWLSTAALAVERLPDLRRFEVILPQYMKKYVVTTSTAHTAWNSIKPFGKRLSEIHVTASVLHDNSFEKLHNCPRELYVAPPSFVMTFVAALPEVGNGNIAAKRGYDVKCVEVSQSEAALARGEYYHLNHYNNVDRAREALQALHKVATDGKTGHTKIWHQLMTPALA